MSFLIFELHLDMTLDVCKAHSLFTLRLNSRTGKIFLLMSDEDRQEVEDKKAETAP